MSFPVNAVRRPAISLLGAGMLTLGLAGGLFGGISILVPVTFAGGSSSAATLASHHLTLSNFPSGWKANTETKHGLTSTDTTGPCFSNIKKSKKIQAVTQSFAAKTTVPQVSEVLGSGKTQLADFSLVRKDFARCKSITIKTGSKKLKGKLRAIPFPAAGRGAKGYILSVATVPYSALEVPFKAKSFVGVFSFGTTGNPDSQTAVAFFTEAQARAAGSPVPAPPTLVTSGVTQGTTSTTSVTPPATPTT